MFGNGSAPVEGTVHHQGPEQALEGEMGLLSGRTRSRIIRGDESGIRLFGRNRKRIEGGKPRCLRVAGQRFTTNQAARPLFSIQKYGFLFSVFRFSR